MDTHLFVSASISTLQTTPCLNGMLTLFEVEDPSNWDTFIERGFNIDPDYEEPGKDPLIEHACFEPNKDFYIQFDGYSDGDLGSGYLSLKSPSIEECPKSCRCHLLDRPANDNVLDAAVLALGVDTPFENVCASGEEGEVGGSTNTKVNILLAFLFCNETCDQSYKQHKTE